MMITAKKALKQVVFTILAAHLPSCCILCRSTDRVLTPPSPFKGLRGAWPRRCPGPRAGS